MNGISDTGTDAAASSLVPVSDASEAGGSDAGSDAGGSDAGGGTLAEDKDDFAGPPEFCIRFKIRAFSSSSSAALRMLLKPSSCSFERDGGQSIF